LIEPNIIPINDHKEKKSYMIYDKFEILEREMAQDLINGIFRVYGVGMNVIYATEDNYLKCEINEGKIIIHYPKNFNRNDKYISVIGQLNNENQFLNEYILIYNDYSSQYNHMNNIKRNLNHYLASLQNQLIENSAPIVLGEYNEIGTIIKYSKETFNYNSNNQPMNKEEIKININNDLNKGTFINKLNEPQNSFIKNDFNLNKNNTFNKWNNYLDEYNLD